jgi:N utilization substance protein B
MLYLEEASGATDPSSVARDFWSIRNATPSVREMAERLYRGASAERADLDRDIQAQITNWELDRVALVERNILRLGSYELKHESRTPAAVVIDEAVEIAKAYGEIESGGFINGVLDGLRRRYRQNAPGAGAGAGAHAMPAGPEDEAKN